MFQQLSNICACVYLFTAQIFIPIHTCDHWLLLVLRIESKVVEIWDSLLQGDESIGKDLVADVVNFLPSSITLLTIWFYTSIQLV